MQRPIDQIGETEPVDKTRRMLVWGIPTGIAAGIALKAMGCFSFSGGSDKSNKTSCNPPPEEEGNGQEKKSIPELMELLFEEKPGIRPPSGEYNENKIEQWAKRYTGADPVYSAKLKKYRNRRKLAYKPLRSSLTEGWGRLVKNGDIQTVYALCQKHNVPFDIIFLGLAESHWNGSAKSRVGAGGYWQFMPKTAGSYGLEVSAGSDERTDVAKSTEAAIIFLKDLYKMTYKWEGKRPPRNIPYTDSDRWAYAFWSYNRGPGRVKPYYKKFDGEARPYASAISKVNSENASYVNKIFGIRAALQELYDQGKLPYGGEQPAPETAEREEPSVRKTPADLLYEDYAVRENSMSAKDKVKFLGKVKNAYQDDLKSGRHTRDYVEDAIDIINNEIADIEEEKPQDFEVSRQTRDTVAKVKVEKGGELALEISNDVSGEAVIVAYDVQGGDTIEKIAIRLCGDPNKYGFVKELLRDLNPEIGNINMIRVGQDLRVPGQYITVQRGQKLPGLLKKYYPGVRSSDAEAYLKYLNGRKPDDKILAGETILVPMIGVRK